LLHSLNGWDSVFREWVICRSRYFCSPFSAHKIGPPFAPLPLHLSLYAPGLFPPGSLHFSSRSFFFAPINEGASDFCRFPPSSSSRYESQPPPGHAPKVPHPLGVTQLSVPFAQRHTAGLLAFQICAVPLRSWPTFFIFFVAPPLRSLRVWTQKTFNLTLILFVGCFFWWRCLSEFKPSLLCASLRSCISILCRLRSFSSSSFLPLLYFPAGSLVEAGFLLS